MDIVVSDLGEEGEAELASWLVEDGTTVEIDQGIAELETGKATVEVPAPASGKLEIFIEVGEVIEPGTVIGRIV